MTRGAVLDIDPVTLAVFVALAILATGAAIYLGSLLGRIAAQRTLRMLHDKGHDAWREGHPTLNALGDRYVVVEVHGGVATVLDASPGVRVVIRDYDVQGMPQGDLSLDLGGYPYIQDTYYTPVSPDPNDAY
jgi:hypothetical protein